MGFFRRNKTQEPSTVDTHEEGTFVADEPEGGAPATTLEELEQRIEKHNQQTVRRLNDMNTAITEASNDLTSKVSEVNSALRQIKTQAQNNADMIAAFQATIDRLERDNAHTQNAEADVAKRVDQLETTQGEINTAVVQGLQSNRDFTLEQFKAAKAYTDKAAAAADKKLQAAADNAGKVYDAVKVDLGKLRTEFENHTHTIDGTTSTPVGNDGGGA